MKNQNKDAPVQLTIAERRQRVADALGFLLARAWLRQHGPQNQHQSASDGSDRQQDQSIQKPP